MKNTFKIQNKFLKKDIVNEVLDNCKRRKILNLMFCS